MKSDVCGLYKLLHNPLRLEMLRHIYESRDGMNVGLLVDAMTHADIKQSCVSQYLKQLEGAGVIVRRRAGKYANYFADSSNARANVREAVTCILDRLRKTPDYDFIPLLGVLMNPFRAAVVCELAKSGPLDSPTICARFNHQVKYLKRDLQVAVDVGLLSIDDTDDPTYRFIAPHDATAERLVALCR